MIEPTIQMELELLADMLVDKHLTIATAESVTSGTLQFLLSQSEHCMQFYQGGITAYNDDQKWKQLHIPYSYTQINHAVTRDVAIQMAFAASRLYHTDIGIGITGFAIRDELCNEPYAHVAICNRAKVLMELTLKGHQLSKSKDQMHYAIDTIIILKNCIDKL